MSDATRVLNPTLYRRLVRAYGHVRVSNEGEAMIYRMQKSLKDTVRLDIDHRGEYYQVCCFAAETLVATPIGDRPISDLVGQQELLVPNAKGLGSWKTVNVRSFGFAPLLTVTLKRGRNSKTIRATPDHRWVTSNRNGVYGQKITADLLPGDRLPGCFARKLVSYGDRAPAVSAVGVAHGFIFGDGSHPVKLGAPAHVVIYSRSKDTALLPFFSACRQEPVVIGTRVHTKVCDLPRAWKNFPAENESLAYLLGWLAGYFAADGHVRSDGKQATLYSANRDNLNFAKGVCYRLGIRVSPIQPKQRGSGGCVPNAVEFPLYGLSFSVRDVPEAFWIQRHHRQRARHWLRTAQPAQPSHWVVAGIEDRGERDEVFCAVVPGIEKFALADNLLTMNCPHCNDTRYRLYVNHMFGQRDESGRRMLQLAHCFNEDCLSDDKHWGDFLERVDDLNCTQVVRKGSYVPPEAREIVLPGSCRPLISLDPTHPACTYLEFDRHFDPMVVGRDYDLQYCLTSHYTFAVSRIIIPIYDLGKLKGWQARFVGELDWKCPDRELRRTLPPKYFSAPGAHFRSQCIYNFDRMKEYRSAVIVEGPTDVWRFGFMAGCLFGNTMTELQSRRFFAIFRRRTAAIVLDPEEFDSATSVKLRAKMAREMPGAVAFVKLPDSTDPGSLDQDFLQAYVKQEAAEQGVDISYERMTA